MKHQAADRLDFSFQKEIDPEKLLPLMQQTGWGSKRTSAGLQKMLDATPMKLGVWDGDRLVGFVRALSDGIYRSLIEDVVVDEPYRRQGIATEMVRLILEKLGGVEDKYLFGDKPIYYRAGFSETPFQSMSIRGK